MKHICIWFSIPSCFFLLVPRIFKNRQNFHIMKKIIIPSYQEIYICVLVTHINPGNNTVFCCLKHSINTICSKYNNQSCTTLYCYSTQFLVTQLIRPYTWNGLQYKLKTFCHQLKRGWYAIECSFVLITKNIWCSKQL